MPRPLYTLQNLIETVQEMNYLKRQGQANVVSTTSVRQCSVGNISPRGTKMCFELVFAQGTLIYIYTYPT